MRMKRISESYLKHKINKIIFSPSKRTGKDNMLIAKLLDKDTEIHYVYISEECYSKFKDMMNDLAFDWGMYIRNGRVYLHTTKSKKRDNKGRVCYYDEILSRELKECGYYEQWEIDNPIEAEARRKKNEKREGERRIAENDAYIYQKEMWEAGAPWRED
jgi:hypothetical protein